MLINMMEHYVDERLSELLKDYNCCKCEVCLEDMKAFSLNRLPPKYVSTVNGQVSIRSIRSRQWQRLPTKSITKGKRLPL